MEAAPLKITNLYKTFGSTKAVRGVDLLLKPGDIYALIGPNGAGKTSLIKTIVGLHYPTKGHVSVAGFDIEDSPIAAKYSLGYIPDNPSGFEYFTGKEMLYFTASLKNVDPKTIFNPTTTKLIDDFQLTNLLNQKLANYSRGNRQKLSFLTALIGNPQVLLIDEPIVGLDPRAITTFGKTLKRLSEEKRSILFSTHILEFGQQFATRVGVMYQGNIVQEKTIKAGTSLAKLYNRIIQS